MILFISTIGLGYLILWLLKFYVFAGRVTGRPHEVFDPDSMFPKSKNEPQQKSRKTYTEAKAEYDAAQKKEEEKKTYENEDKNGSMRFFDEFDEYLLKKKGEKDKNLKNRSFKEMYGHLKDYGGNVTEVPMSSCPI